MIKKERRYLGPINIRWCKRNAHICDWEAVSTIVKRRSIAGSVPAFKYLKKTGWIREKDRERAAEKVHTERERKKER